MPVSGGHQIQYKLTVVNTNGAPITQQVKITDNLPPSGITITAMTVGGVPQAVPAATSFDIIVPANAFVGNTATVLINAIVAANAAPTTYTNMSALFYGNL